MWSGPFIRISQRTGHCKNKPSAEDVVARSNEQAKSEGRGKNGSSNYWLILARVKELSRKTKYIGRPDTKTDWWMGEWYTVACWSVNSNSNNHNKLHALIGSLAWIMKHIPQWHQRLVRVAMCSQKRIYTKRYLASYLRLKGSVLLFIELCLQWSLKYLITCPVNSSMNY